ncbi:MAG: hypothetical protein L0312_26650 [Acidobacteria bacterium]|nr:hypothetical protein [Acidobacteriota bacterium]
MDFTLLNIAHAVIIILISLNLLLTAGLYVIYKKRNGAGEKSAEYWEAWFGKVLAAIERLERMVIEVKKLVEKLVQQ